jgi:hypothetical protein
MVRQKAVDERGFADAALTMDKQAGHPQAARVPQQVVKPVPYRRGHGVVNEAVFPEELDTRVLRREGHSPELGVQVAQVVQHQSDQSGRLMRKG